MDDVERRTRGVRDVGSALHCVGFDKRRTRRVPGLETAAPLRVACLQSIAEDPGDLDRFRMRAHHTAVLGRRFAQPEQEAIVDVRQAETGAFAAPIVHEYLEARNAVVAYIGADTAELRFGRNDEMIAEVDA